jgi:nucleotide-binding universal stress UspA family protein
VPTADGEPRAFEIGKDGLAVIIVGIDGGSPALNAAAWAAGLARRERARLVLVFMEPVASPAYWTPIALTGAAEVSTEFVDELRNSAARHLKSQDVSWTVEHRRGDAATGLEAIAEEHRADCIVIGRSHEGGSMGSVAKALINLATRPVVVVP